MPLMRAKKKEIRVVSDGRALGSADNFRILQGCATALGAAVAASRAAVDAGYAPHSPQVGQTDRNVSPRLYIACGISGSVQHFADMKRSRVVVVINGDSLHSGRTATPLRPAPFFASS